MVSEKNLVTLAQARKVPRLFLSLDDSHAARGCVISLSPSVCLQQQPRCKAIDRARSDTHVCVQAQRRWISRAAATRWIRLHEACCHAKPRRRGGSARMTDVIADRGSTAYLGSECKNDIPVVSQPTTIGSLRVYKIVVLGEGGVGKSAVTLQFVSHTFLSDHDPTIEDSYQKQAVIDGEAAMLDILDTAGQHLQVEFTAMRDQYMRCGEGFMICYSVTDRRSFQEVPEYRKLISQVRANEDFPLVLVGNKYDLQHQREVTTEEGKALANQMGCPFYETSAALRQFIDDAFCSLVRQIRVKERSQSTPRKHSRWWRLRSIFAFIFRRKPRQNPQYSP